MKQIKNAETDKLASRKDRSVRDLQVRRIPIEQVIPDPRNARTHSVAQVAAVAASICEFGWTNPILVRPNGVVIAGHARLLAARRLGLREVPVIELSGLNEVQCRVLAIADNQLALNAGGDEDLLRVELGRLKPGRVKPLILSTSAGSEGCSNHKHSSTYLDSADLSGPDAVGGVYGPVHAGILGGT